jgi:hypothetical protein
MPRKTGAKKTTFGADLIEGMELVLAHQRGKLRWSRSGRSQSTSRPFASGWSGRIRQAYGFGNFNNYRLRVRIMCS